MSDEGDLLQVEGLAFPGAPPVTIQDVGNLTVAALFE
jgi:hypothetical protein